jgi:anhydro-N-acetylmuramic acid kinase
VLGELYAEAVADAQRQSRVKAELVGCHGQTLYHSGDPEQFLGRRIASTWQTGDGSLVAGRLGIPAVTDFRPADMAAGGKGAPLVPFLDYLLYRHARRGRVVQNLGGIGNLTALPGGAGPQDVIAFDTGPGNMVIDAVTESGFGRPYDRDGRIAARGRVMESLIDWAFTLRFFRAKPPRTAGREQFGREFVTEFLRRAGRARPEDMVATATALTARSIGDALRRYVIPSRSNVVRTKAKVEQQRYRDYIVSGGGARNRTLMEMIRTEVEPLGLKVRTTDDLGLPSEAKEAAAFAVLAYETWHREPSNIPSATGASRPAILGKISHA